MPLIAANADEAVTVHGQGLPPDAMLVDFRLPSGRDGIAAIALLRAAFARAVGKSLAGDQRTAVLHRAIPFAPI